MKNNSYSHLTQVERLQIEEALSRGFSYRQIAKMLGRSHTTVGREVRRNRDETGQYRCCVAHAKSRVRRTDASSKPWKVTEAHIENIYQRVCKGESPDSIAHPDDEELKLSTPWVYEIIDRQIKHGDEDFDKHLLQRKYKRRRGGKRKDACAARIPNRVDIDERPKYVEKRWYYGDWEADLVIGKRHVLGAIVTLVERKSRFMVCKHVVNKTKNLVADAIIEALTPYVEGVNSITFDNGLEFAGHERVAEKLGCRTYFAKPYRSYERGTNENLNGELRRYFPKSWSLAYVDPDWLAWALLQINGRRRKILKYKTAQQLFNRAIRRAKLRAAA